MSWVSSPQDPLPTLETLVPTGCSPPAHPLILASIDVSGLNYSCNGYQLGIL